ncbi:multiple inositol polyphosphate phosphatase 1 [Fopius arisanus]|uniref:Multiple inositol polyphosphate phosphatase 1 n=1 Tax=Fopius arisanus TaxID=64838 RepID=A0A9R1TFT0_9HYME|nr:PREDICTED: multiple inositol polyphosphate phosphatase 1-like [Fopius arisanus]
MKLLIFLVLCIGYTWARQTDYCYAHDSDPYLKFGSVTAFQADRNEYRPIPYCEARQIWMLSRHGNRYPHDAITQDLKGLGNVRDQIFVNHRSQRLGQFNGHLCDEDLENFSKWSLNVNMTMQMTRELTPEASRQTKSIARQIRAGFPNLFPFDLGDKLQNYVFRATKSQSTQATLQEFMVGLVIRSTPIEPEMNDTLLQAYQCCSHWKDGDENDPHHSKELTEFLRGHEFSVLIRNVSSRLGYGYDLSADTILHMYDMCRYDAALDTERVSPWCAAFSKEQLKVLEYATDLQYFYNAGPGRNANKIIGCFALKDMINRFRRIEENATGEPKGVFYFTHAFTILSFLQNLGAIDENEKLTAENYRSMMNRKWRTSNLVPFNANIVAVFYKCSGGQDQVMFYMQGKQMRLPGCDVGLCRWDYLKEKLAEALSQCTEDKCYGRSGSLISQSLISLIAILSIGSILLK